jgi:hypothetical protein
MSRTRVGALTIVFAFGASACAEPRAAEPDTAASSTPDVVAPSTRAMIDRLRQIVDRNDYTSILESMDAAPPSTDEREALEDSGRRAYVLLHSGRHEEAAAQILEVLARANATGRSIDQGVRRNMRNLLALSAIWGTFEDACLADGEACAYPLDPDAYGPEHTERLEAAVRLFEAKLTENPADDVSIWLLNMAHMALGTYPDEVPPPWRISPDEFYPQADFSRFPDRARQLGVDVIGHAGSVVFDDLDNDGDFDLLVSGQSLRDSVRYFENRDGAFHDETPRSGLHGMVGGLNLLHGDYDNDGDEDVFSLRGAWSPDGQPHPGQTAAWGDYDNDGLLDLVVGNEGEARGAQPRIHPLELYRNNGDGTFTDVAREAGVWANRFVKAVSWGDYDNDGRLDLLVSAFDEPNALYHNEGPGPDGTWRFSEVVDAGIERPLSSLPAWWFDFDNDGWLDIFIAAYKVDNVEQMRGYRSRPEVAETPQIYRNRGDGSFEDITERIGLDRVVHSMGSNFGDLDNDGWLDFYLGTGDPDLHTIVPNVMFRNIGGQRLEDVSVAGGFSQLSKGHGVAFTDVDYDGDQDIYVVLGGAVEADVARNVLWENPGHGNTWVTLRFEGVDSNRSALHTRVRVTFETPGGSRSVHRVVGSGGSFGASSLQQEIGLGDATRITEIEVLWHGSGLVESFTDVDLERIYSLVEGAGVLVPVEQQVVPLDVGPR